MILSDFIKPITFDYKSVDGDDWRQYQNAMYLTNRKLKTIGQMVNLQLPLTMYVARHSWATVAKGMDVPLSVISAGMGHDSEVTTQIYLASLENAVVDNANGMILRQL